MMKGLMLFSTLAAGMIVSSPAFAADSLPEKPVSALVSLGAEFSSGGQGSGSETQNIYVPLIFTWFPTERIDMGIEVPYLSQSGPSPTRQLYPNSRSAASTMTPRRGGAGGGSVTTGPGDIIARFGLLSMFETEKLPQLRESVYVKFPTASKADGLGTGEFDAGAGIDAVKWSGDLQLVGDLFYNYQGKAEDFGLMDYISSTAGLGWQVSGSLRPMVLMKGATSLSRDSGALLEARLRLLWSLTPETSLDLYYSRGIAAGSPDWGGGLAVIHSY